MDIVVTIPKSEYHNDELESVHMKEEGLLQFWTLSKVPKRLAAGDRIYFVKNQQVESSMRVIDIKTDSSMQCETTGRTWSGKCQIVMDDLREEELLNVRGFQGFRYRWW
ncbi:hypothetical protein [Jeotgalibacillus proteolyticus]|uniref:DUF3850 domain-containing protein n=1 Tax=Jeotgalibacillus proteolyticus TaxID=2082395 RepID=A0A2S5GAU9_9BACL|nr:hypothetical protein [Jeotgalibacillus proteolyticus]PPA70051.1 hypothetical protein C4B60_10675 [Jeotgalibacillus proteolyticus]